MRLEIHSRDVLRSEFKHPNIRQHIPIDHFLKKTNSIHDRIHLLLRFRYNIRHLVSKLNRCLLNDFQEEASTSIKMIDLMKTMQAMITIMDGGDIRIKGLDATFCFFE